MGLELKVLKGKTAGRAVFQYSNDAGMDASWTLSTSDTGAALVVKLDRMLQFLRTYHAPSDPAPETRPLASVHQLPVQDRSVAQAPERDLPAEAISLMQRLGQGGEGFGPRAIQGGLQADIARAEEMGYEMIPPEEQELR